jgi:Ca-activated chloride channel family protein
MRNFTILFFLWLSVVSLQAQVLRKVKGVLTDPQSGEPMPGVNIVVKGTATGTVTDLNGSYEIDAPVGATLVFSFVGYATKEMIVTPEEDIPGDTDKTPQKVFKHTIPDDPNKTLSPYFFVKSDNRSVDQLPLKATSAAVNIAGVIADVRVKQVYINTGKNPLEAVYIFPGSTRAAVYAMQMTIGSRKIIAKIREKQQARKDYEQARKEGKTATLLEQKRPNIFQMNVANILPGDTITVELSYTELLIPVEGTYEFVYPTVVGPRYSTTPDDELHADENWIENPYHHQGEQPDYTFDLKTKINSGIPIQKITSPSHTVQVQYESKNAAMINLSGSESLGGNRDFILRYRLRGGEVESGLLLYPRGDENFFLLMVEPPEAPTLDQIPGREYIFIVDVSGSMQGFPIDVSKKLLRNLISGLRPTDKFNVMLFESSNRMLHEESVEASERNIREAIQVLERQPGGGGTELLPALRNALTHEKEEEFSRTFVVITDGYVNIEKEAFNLVRKNLNNANLFAIGIGSSVNRYLIEGLAHAGMGEPFIVTNEKEAETVGKKFKTFVETPVLTNIKIDYGKFQVADVEPVSIPDVFAERPIIVYGKYTGDATGAIKLSGFSGNRTYRKVIDVATASTQNNQALRYLWARNKIKYLDDFAGYYEDDYNSKEENKANRVKQVTDLGLKYSLLTEYTSFIAIDSLVRNETGKQQQIKQPLPLPQHITDGALWGLAAGISLSPDVQALSEVIVTGYGEVSKTNLVSSVASVESEEALSNALSINNSISGRVAGVQINQNSGVAGSNTSVRIRGNASVALSNSPLYVIDGVPVDNTDHPGGTAGVDHPDRLSDINPEDIESMQIIKSGSANAIYGSRGANGVVVITTKKGKSGRREINFTSSFSVDKVNKLPELQHEYVQGAPSGGSLQWQGGDSKEIFSWGPSLNSLFYDGSNYAYDNNGRLTSNGLANGRPAQAYDRYNFFQTGFTSDNHLRISKTLEKTKYSLSAGHTLQHGIIPGSLYKRTTLNVLLEKRFLGKIKVGSTAFLAHSLSDLVQKGNSFSSVMFGWLTTPPSFDNQNGIRGSKALQNPNAYSFSDGSQRSYNGGLTDNPYWSIAKNPYHGIVNRIVPSVYGEYTFLQDFSAKYKLGADVYEDHQTSGFDKYSAAMPLGQVTDRMELYKSLNSEFIVNGQKNVWNDRININLTGGIVNFAAQRKISRTDGYGLIDAGIVNTQNATNVAGYQKVYAQTNSRLLSKVTLRYQDFLSIDFSATSENTSTLAKGNNRMYSGWSRIGSNVYRATLYFPCG